MRKIISSLLLLSMGILILMMQPLTGYVKASGEQVTGTYNLIDTSKHGADGQEYDAWDK